MPPAPPNKKEPLAPSIGWMLLLAGTAGGAALGAAVGWGLRPVSTSTEQWTEAVNAQHAVYARGLERQAATIQALQEQLAAEQAAYAALHRQLAMGRASYARLVAALQRVTDGAPPPAFKGP